MLSQIDGPNRGRIGRRRWDVLQHEPHELIFALDLQGFVGPALETDRRHRLPAQGTPAYGTRESARQNLDVVGKRLQLLRRFEKISCARFRAGCQLRPAQVPNHQRVSAQQEPGFRATRLVSDQQANVLRRVAGSVQRLDLDIAEVENIAFFQPEELIPGSGTHVQNVLGAGEYSEFAPRGDVVGMNMGVNHVANLHAVLFRYL